MTLFLRAFMDSVQQTTDISSVAPFRLPANVRERLTVRRTTNLAAKYCALAARVAPIYRRLFKVDFMRSFTLERLII